MKKRIVILIALLALLIGCSNLDPFAQCLADNNAKMYGAYWCAACDRQKDMFGSSFDKIEYIECSLQGKRDQTAVCKKEGITSYPTWDFDGERVEGVLTFKEISQNSGCEI